jgi:SAM-dependent methyltransferase
MSGPDAQRALEKYRRLAGGYDRRTAPTAPLRRRAIERLRLASGDTVVEVACGTGINFPLIEEHIGPSGRLIGIDLSPEMLAQARTRVDRSAWRNVTLVEASVERARLPAAPDASLFSLTHDLLQMPEGLANLFGQAKPGAHVAAFGPKPGSRLAFLVDPLVKAVAHPYVTTFEGLDRPWGHLERYVPDLSARRVLLGGAYLAWGALGRDVTEAGGG